LPAAYRKRISELFGKLRAKYGIVRESRWEEKPALRKDEQLALF
jgi:hypothetical protein